MNKLVKVASADRVAEVEGVWREFSVDGTNVFRVKLRRAGATNPAFAKLGEEIQRKYRLSGTELHDIESPKQREHIRELYANAVIADWNEDDFGVPFSTDEAIKTMEASPEFQDWVVNQASRAAEYRAKHIEANAGK